jgi:nucleoside-diphosphate-sugar epimerase
VKVLVAGITGQLGHGLVEVAAEHDVELVPLTRRIGRRDATARLGRMFRDAPELAERAIEGDVTAPYWGLSAARVRRLAGELDAVLDIAGETNWAAPTRRLHAVNVLGALHGQQLAKAIGDHGDTPLFCYASSVHAAGAVRGLVAELPFPANGERTAYEQSKWLAERRLLDAGRMVPTAIARIGGLVGNSVTGATAKRNSLYMLADRWESMPGGLMPYVRKGRVDMLPRDHAARLLLGMIGRLRSQPPGESAIAHVCAGESAPTTDALLAAIDYVAEGRVPSRRRVPVPARALVWSSNNLDRLRNFPAAEQNLLVGLRYLALDRVFERGRIASLVDGPLPKVSAEQLARLTFESEATEPPPLEGDLALARFAG